MEQNSNLAPQEAPVLENTQSETDMSTDPNPDTITQIETLLHRIAENQVTFVNNMSAFGEDFRNIHSAFENVTLVSSN